VLLHRRQQRLAIGLDLPHADHALAAARDHAPTVGGARDRADAPLVGVVYGEHDLARLGVEAADLAVVPAADDHGAVARENNRAACFVGHLSKRRNFSCIIFESKTKGQEIRDR